MTLEKQDWEAKITMGLSYQHLPYIMRGLWGKVTASGSGPYQRTYVSPQDAPPTNPAFYTVEYGPKDAEYQLAGGLITEATIKGEVGSAWTADFSMKGGRATPQAYTALAEPSVDLIRFANTLLYIDDWGGTIGSTQISNAFINFEYQFTTGRHLKRFSGDVWPAAYGEGEFLGGLKLALEYNSTTKTIFDAALSGLKSLLVRIKGVSGTNQAILDFAGYLAGNPELFPDREGNTIMNLELKPRYNATLGYWGQVDTYNDLSSL